MNDKEFQKAWFGFMECIRDHDLKKSLSDFLQDFYSKNGLQLQDLTDDELKIILLENLEDEVSTCLG